MRKIIACIATALAVTACSTIDCPLSNAVYATYRLAGPLATLADTLTISTPRTGLADTVLLNRAVQTDSFALPMSYSHTTDVLYLDICPADGQRTIDTVTISKTPRPHFEAVDCPPAYFHTLTAVSSTHHRIDSIQIHYPDVNYDATKTHFILYLRPAADR